MKKGIALPLSLAVVVVLSATFPLGRLHAQTLEWKLPVFTLRYEIAQGAIEDTDDELLLPSSLRNTVSLRVKEDADPASFGLTLKYSAKDYFQEKGDYGYYQLDHDGTFRLSDLIKLGYTLGGKSVDFPELDSNGLSKNYVSLKAGSSATLTLAKGTTLDATLNGRFDLAEEPVKSLHLYALSAGFATRLGEWQLSARYRGELRLPLAVPSSVLTDQNHSGSLSLQWDPNK